MIKLEVGKMYVDCIVREQKDLHSDRDILSIEKITYTEDE